jgi:DNA-binding GntR family transcriptional regulator
MQQEAIPHFGEVPRSMLRDQIREVILARILDGTYEPGDRIVENRLMAEFHVSQAPIRESLRELEAMRFIESEPHRGTRVREVSLPQLSETYPVRAALEGLAGLTATPRMTDDILAELANEIQEMRNGVASGDTHAQLHHDVEFHRIIVRAAGNSVLSEVWDSLHLELRTLVTFQISADLPGIAESHVPILEALTNRDAALASERLRDHFTYAEHLISQQLNS